MILNHRNGIPMWCDSIFNPPLQASASRQRRLADTVHEIIAGHPARFLQRVNSGSFLPFADSTPGHATLGRHCPRRDLKTNQKKSCAFRRNMVCP